MQAQSEKSKKREGYGMKRYYLTNNLCVCCGAPVPEGYMVCPICQKAAELGKGSSYRTKKPPVEEEAEVRKKNISPKQNRNAHFK